MKFLAIGSLTTANTAQHEGVRVPIRRTLKAKDEDLAVKETEEIIKSLKEEYKGQGYEINVKTVAKITVGSISEKE